MPIKVSGIGVTQFGELWNLSLTDLLKEAVDKALADSKLNPEQIDMVYVGSMLSGETSGVSQLGSLVTSLYGIGPAMRIEGACASGGLAVAQGVQALKAGAAKNILVVGIEKMTDLCTEDIASHLMQAASEDERLSGATFPALYALMAQAHMAQYGTTREQMALSSVIAHKNAAKNLLAQFRNQISIEQVLNATAIAEPFTLLDCSPISDGAAAVILSKTNEPQPNHAYLIGSSIATDSLGLAGRRDLHSLAATENASSEIFQQTSLSPEDIDFVEVHDCFSIASIMALENIGFAKPGSGGALLAEIHAGTSKLKFNLSGGLKAAGHPVGATGVKQIAELTRRLRQSPAAHALAHNVGGTGATAVLHILKSQ